MTNDRSFFTEFSGNRTEKVAVANRQYITFEGVGGGYLHCRNKMIPVTDVLYIPNLERNLLSVMKLTKQGNVAMFQDRNCVISKGKHVLAEGRIVNDLYQLTCEK